MRGSIRKRGIPGKETYQIRVELGVDPETGRRKEISKSGFKQKRVAEKALAELITQIEKGEYFVPEKITIEKYLKKWLQEYVKLNVSFKTYESYKNMIEQYIIPNIGFIGMDKLKPVQLQSFYTKCITELNLSATTTLYFHNILHNAFKHAVKWQMIKINPADSVEKPKKSKHNVKVLNLNETNILLKSFEGTIHYILILLAITTGMRRSEILGLKWYNVDLENGIIYVENQLQNINGELQIVPTKTNMSRRKIDMLDYTIPILKEHKQKQEENKELLEGYIDKGFVICNPLNGEPYNPDYITRHFARRMKTISKNTGIPDITFHELRHTHATLMLQAGVPVKIASERLGHTTVSMSLNTYTHVLPNMQKAAADKLNLLFDNPQRENE